ncbi:hypothetical protein IQ238_26405 [Pleurocapsales cyanobacterium LEGE 06147]|nr:hypothetical protein [Pleurocapsales cyanobacterium LEGE 06147]
MLPKFWTDLLSHGCSEEKNGVLFELWTELSKLKKDTLFMRNLGITTMTAIVLTIGLAEVHRQPARVSQQEKLVEWSSMISVGMVVKAHQVFRF